MLSFITSFRLLVSEKPKFKLQLEDMLRCLSLLKTIGMGIPPLPALSCPHTCISFKVNQFRLLALHQPLIFCLFHELT